MLVRFPPNGPGRYASRLTKQLGHTSSPSIPEKSMSYPMGRFTDCEGRLQRDFAEFARLWSSVREDWLDDRCRQFERDHLTTLGPSLSRFAAALHEFSDAVRKADVDLQEEKR